MIECHCIKCGYKLDAILFSPSKLFVKCPECSTLHLIKLSDAELLVKIKQLSQLPLNLQKEGEK